MYAPPGPEYPMGSWTYFVHYQGWNVRWDKWVDEDVLLKDCKESQEMAVRLREIKKKKGKKPSFDEKNKEALDKREKDMEEKLAEKNEKLTKEELKKRQRLEFDEASLKRAKYLKSNNLVDTISRNDITSITEQQTNNDMNGNGGGVNSMRLVIPFVLKKLLVDDWELLNGGDIIPETDGTAPPKKSSTKTITHLQQFELKERKVLDLPAKVSIREIFDKFLKDKEESMTSNAASKAKDDLVAPSPAASTTTTTSTTTTRTTTEDDNSKPADPIESNLQKWRSLLSGITTYFNKALPLFLLYKNERLQYHVMKTSSEVRNKPLIDVYGVEHLLRLFVKLPYIVNGSDITEGEARQLLMKLGELLKFVQKNIDDLKGFGVKYRTPSAAELSEKERDARQKKLKDDAKMKKERMKGVKVVEEADKMVVESTSSSSSSS